MAKSDNSGSPGAPPPDAEETQEAALDAVQPDRLLPGEDEATTHLDDAGHWLKVYTELYDFKRSLLNVAEARVVTMEGAARTEVEETDLLILIAEAERLERRLRFWDSRYEALRGEPER
jgi:hypothetical protein